MGQTNIYGYVNQGKWRKLKPTIISIFTKRLLHDAGDEVVSRASHERHGLRDHDRRQLRLALCSSPLRRESQRHNSYSIHLRLSLARSEFSVSGTISLWTISWVLEISTTAVSALFCLFSFSILRKRNTRMTKRRTMRINSRNSLSTCRWQNLAKTKWKWCNSPSPSLSLLALPAWDRNYEIAIRLRKLDRLRIDYEIKLENYDCFLSFSG